MRDTVLNLLSLVHLTDIRSEEIKKYIEPYDIFDSDDYFSLLKNFDNGEGIQKVVAQRASKEFRLRYCNYPNEVAFDTFKSVQKTGTRPGVVVISETPIEESCIVKFKIVKEGNPGLGLLGFGICDKSCLNICPFLPSKTYGLFAAYYTNRRVGNLNLADLGDRFVPAEYDRYFSQGDVVNMAVDLPNSALSFGINDVTLPDKRVNLKKITSLHLAIWLSDPGDEIELAFEY